MQVQLLSSSNTKKYGVSNLCLRRCTMGCNPCRRSSTIACLHSSNSFCASVMEAQWVSGCSLSVILPTNAVGCAACSLLINTIACGTSSHLIAPHSNCDRRLNFRFKNPCMSSSSADIISKRIGLKKETFSTSSSRFSAKQISVFSANHIYLSTTNVCLFLNEFV